MITARSYASRKSRGYDTSNRQMPSSRRSSRARDHESIAQDESFKDARGNEFFKSSMKIEDPHKTVFDRKRSSTRNETEPTLTPHSMVRAAGVQSNEINHPRKYVT